jgi:hypothetical protein
MRSRRTRAVLCVLVLPVFAVFLQGMKGGNRLNGKASESSAGHALISPVLTVDGTDPMPRPIPLPTPWAA